jgi:hypothetical protein
LFRLFALLTQNAFFPAVVADTIPTGMGVVPDLCKRAENKQKTPVSEFHLCGTFLR